MRNLRAPSEIRRLAAPVAQLLDAAWQRMHWWVATMAVLYLASGITIVRSDEVAVVLRWGRLVGDTPALQEHGPGLLFALPRPVDQVVRVQVKHVWEIPVHTLAPGGGQPPPMGDPSDEEDLPQVAFTIDPVTQGYALTGDNNIVHVDMVARYRVRDPAEWAFLGPKAEDALRVEVTAAMVRSLGEMGVDRVLADGRKDLISKTAQRAQVGLDASHAGLELASLELTNLAPPTALSYDFAAVQSAYIEAETKKKDAQTYAESAIPGATAEADVSVQSARADAAAALAAARGDAASFGALAREYRASPVVVRERLYRDGIERALRTALIRWVPPPVDGSYHGFRITMPAGSAGVARPAIPPG